MGEMNENTNISLNEEIFLDGKSFDPSETNKCPFLAEDF